MQPLAVGHGRSDAAVGAYHQHKADRIVAEGNQGGDLVRHTLATVSPNVPISIVHASRSKQAPPKSLMISASTSRNRRAHLVSPGATTCSRLPLVTADRCHIRAGDYQPRDGRSFNEIKRERDCAEPAEPLNSRG